MTQQTTPEALLAHLVKVVDQVSAIDMVQHKFPEWTPPRGDRPLFKASPMEQRQQRLAERPVLDRLIWRRETSQSERHYPQAIKRLADKEQALARVVKRDPCVCCGVRHDIHHSAGCATYREARI